MSEEPFDLTGALPFDRDANDNASAVLGVPGPFLYIGTGLTAQMFGQYVQSYNFGRIPPSYLVLHHTAIPSTLAARFPSGAVWDDGERGLSDAAIFQKRTKQLDKLAKYYQDTMGWDRGPHLFIDDRFIWLFTPMNAVGIHAKEGNSYTKDGKLYYSIGVEVLGYYEHKTWSAAVAANVRAACQALSSRLGISLRYAPAPLHTPAAHAGQLSSHRDYNKPACPGAAITEAYYTSVVQPTILHTVIAGPHGAIAQQARLPASPAARYYPPGVEIACDDLQFSYWHCADHSGFIPLGQVQA